MNPDECVKAPSLGHHGSAMGIAALLGVIGQSFTPASADPPCDMPATAYLDTQVALLNNGKGSITFEIAGELGIESLTFASGQTASVIADVIALFAKQTGVTAECDCDETWETTGVNLKSTSASAKAFVSVQQLNGATPIVMAAEDTGKPSYAITTSGKNGPAGDADCDGAVGSDDLAVVLKNWGECSSPCPGDLTGDNVVNVDDLLRVINNWGNSE